MYKKNNFKIMFSLSVLTFLSLLVYFNFGENYISKVESNADQACSRITYNSNECLNYSCGPWSAGGTRTCVGSSRSSKEVWRCSIGANYVNGSPTCSFIQRDVISPIGTTKTE